MINNRRLIPLTVLTVFYTIIPFFFITQCNKLAQARIVDRKINTAESFYYIDSFCFNKHEEEKQTFDNRTTRLELSIATVSSGLKWHTAGM